MTADELRAWRDRLGYSNKEAADALALTLSGYHHQLYGRRPVSPQTEKLALMTEQLEKLLTLEKQT